MGNKPFVGSAELARGANQLQNFLKSIDDQLRELNTSNNKNWQAMADVLKANFDELAKDNKEIKERLANIEAAVSEKL